MVIGDDDMIFSPTSYKMTRADTLRLYENYEQTIALQGVDDWQLFQTKNELLFLNYNELLIIQSSFEYWNKLMNDSDLNFRRSLLTKLYNLMRSDIMEELGITEGAASNLFNNATFPKWPRPFKLSILLNHPWQLVNKVIPDPFSYGESPEYFEKGVSKQISLVQLSDERTKVKSINGYVILDSYSLFQHEPTPITGRWVTTYPEFDYFEFHLNQEPLVDKVLRKQILRLFPQAKYIITTFLPCKPAKRALWTIIPKNEALGSYQGMLHELKEYRDQTEFHILR